MNKNVTDVIKHNKVQDAITNSNSERVSTAFEAYIRRIRLNRAYDNNNSAQILEELLF